MARDDYVRYLTTAEQWAADRSWNVEPDVVEFGLFEIGKKVSRDRLKVDDDDSEVARGDPKPSDTIAS